MRHGVARLRRRLHATTRRRVRKRRCVLCFCFCWYRARRRPFLALVYGTVRSLSPKMRCFTLPQRPPLPTLSPSSPCCCSLCFTAPNSFPPFTLGSTRRRGACPGRTRRALGSGAARASRSDVSKVQLPAVNTARRSHGGVRQLRTGDLAGGQRELRRGDGRARARARAS